MTQADNPMSHQCPQCGSKLLSAQSVRTAIWRGDALVVVEDVPAIVCGACAERFYDDATATRLDLMQGSGFPDAQAVRHLSVPVFSFAHRIPADLAEVTEMEA